MRELKSVLKSLNKNIGKFLVGNQDHEIILYRCFNPDCSLICRSESWMLYNLNYCNPQHTVWKAVSNLLSFILVFIIVMHIPVTLCRAPWDSGTPLNMLHRFLSQDKSIHSCQTSRHLHSAHWARFWVVVVKTSQPPLCSGWSEAPWWGKQGSLGWESEGPSSSPKDSSVYLCRPTQWLMFLSLSVFICKRISAVPISQKFCFERQIICYIVTCKVKVLRMSGSVSKSTSFCTCFLLFQIKMIIYQILSFWSIAKIVK